jgi:O-antigen/teichoic acid export membrane protein
MLHQFSKKRVRQVGSLSTAVIASVVVGFVSSIVTTRILEPAGYGDMKFIQNFFQFLAILFAIGVFPSGALLLTRIGGNETGKQELIGALLIITSALSIFSILVAVGFSFIENAIFGNNLGQLILFTAPLAAIFLFQPCLEYILQGDNQIYKLSVFRILPGLLYILFMVCFNLLFKVTLTTALMILIFTGAVVTISIIFLLHPQYSRFAENKALIWDTNKRYGRHVYMGSLSSVATSYLSTFMISYFLDNTQVGFFSLAVTLTLPLMQIPNAVGTTYFKDFANIDFLPKKVTMVSVGITLIILMIFLVIIKPLVLLVYTKSFSDVASLCLLTAFGSASFGVGDYINRFLGAHGKGKELRNGAFIVGAVNIVGYSALVILIGVTGAAITQLLAGAVYLLTMMNYYRRYRLDKMQTVTTAAKS